MTEKEKFFDWLEEERAKGLTGLKFIESADRAEARSEEEIYAELNRMIAAPAAEVDLELFPSGKNVF